MKATSLTIDSYTKISGTIPSGANTGKISVATSVVTDHFFTLLEICSVFWGRILHRYAQWQVPLPTSVNLFPASGTNSQS